MRSRRPRGFTLLEAVATIAIVSLLGIGLAALLAIAARAQALSLAVGDAQDAGTLASSMIARELREMRGPGGIGLVAMSTSELRFRHIASPPGREVRYALREGALVRTQTESLEDAKVLAEGVSDFTVTYRGASGAVVADSAAVRRIDFSFRVTRGGEVEIFGGQIYPRELGPVTAAWREE